MRSRIIRKINVPKKCYLCEQKVEPHFFNLEILKRFITDRGKIMPRARTGICAMHQRRLTRAIKQGRHLALLPFVVRQ